jgi:hypothetical protein
VFRLGEVEPQTFEPVKPHAPQSVEETDACFIVRDGNRQALAQSIGDASTLGRGYGKRIDEMIATLETNGVPVLWIGLPAIRGTRTDWRHQLPQRALSEANWQNRREFAN